MEPGTGIELNERQDLLVFYHTRLEVLEAGSGYFFTTMSYIQLIVSKYTL